MEQYIGLKSIVGLLRRQAWAMTIVVFAFLLVTTILVYSIKPRFTATSMVIVDIGAKDLLDSSKSSVYAPGDINARVESEVEILQSDNALLKVIRDENLTSDMEFGPSYGLIDQLKEHLNLTSQRQLSQNQLEANTLQRLRAATRIARRELTYVIGISVTSQDARKAARLANEIATSYIEQQVQSKVAKITASRNVIQGQLGQANAAVVNSERNFDDYLLNNLDKIKENSSSPKVLQLNSDLDSIKQQTEALIAKIKVAESSLARGDIFAGIQNESMRELERRKQDLAFSLNEANDGSSRAVNLKAELDAADKELSDQAVAEIDKLKQEMSLLTQRAEVLRQELRAVIMASNLPPEIYTDIYSLQQNAEIARNQYQNLLQRLRELDTQAQIQLADSRVVNAALVPASPSSPNRRLMFIVSLACALGFGAVTAILREHFVGGFTSEDQVEPVLRVKLATVVPMQNHDASLITHSVADLIVTSPLSIFAESIRRLRVGLERLLADKLALSSTGDRRECVVVVVSSSEPDEGKSTLSLALGRTLAKSGKKTLLIDCDLRKPSVSTLLGVERSSWFADLLLGTDAAQHVSKQTIADPLSDLSVIVGNRVTDMATDDLVMGERFSQFISAARRHFEYIIIDTPPVEPVVDALYIARQADLIVFVVRWASTSQQMVRKSLSALVDNARRGTPAMVALNQKTNIRSESGYKYSGFKK